jgi:hypothetical protein
LVLISTRFICPMDSNLKQSDCKALKYRNFCNKRWFLAAQERVDHCREHRERYVALYVNKLENLQHGQVGQYILYHWQASSDFDPATRFAVGRSKTCLGKLKLDISLLQQRL